MKAIIGIDIGTTSTKTLAYGTDGRIFSEIEKEYPLYSSIPSEKEQDPEEVYAAVIETLRETVTTLREQGVDTAGVGFSSAMHNIMAVDEGGNPLTRLVTWADQRSVKETEALKEGSGHEIFLRTGTPIHPMSPLTKLMWYREHEPDLFKRAAKWISIKEFVFYRLFGTYAVDYSIASATGLFHLKNLDWDEEALQTAGITKAQLSDPTDTNTIFTGLQKELQKEIGLSAETPFVIGASDGVLANVGSGALAPGVVACSIGTSGAVRTVIDQPYVDPKQRIFCYALSEGRWVIGGPINNGGIALRWARDKLFPDLKKLAEEEGKNPYEVLNEIIDSVAPASDGLIFLPYLIGERAPFWNSDTKGMFFGLTLHHGREHMLRSVMEGVMMQMYSVVIALMEAGVEPKQFRAGGGFARSQIWKQMMADMFETEIVIPESHQGSCYGAAWMAMEALNMVESLDSIEQTISIDEKQYPIQKNVTAYRDIKPIFLRMARDLQDEFKAISDVQRSHAEGKRQLSADHEEEIL